MWVRSLILWSDLHFYEGPSFFAAFWILPRILYIKTHFLCRTTKFCLRARLSEPWGHSFEVYFDSENPNYDLIKHLQVKILEMFGVLFWQENICTLYLSTTLSTYWGFLFSILTQCAMWTKVHVFDTKITFKQFKKILLMEEMKSGKHSVWHLSKS